MGMPCSLACACDCACELCLCTRVLSVKAPTRVLSVEDSCRIGCRIAMKSETISCCSPALVRHECFKSIPRWTTGNKYAVKKQQFYQSNMNKLLQRPETLTKSARLKKTIRDFEFWTKHRACATKPHLEYPILVKLRMPEHTHVIWLKNLYVLLFTRNFHGRPKT